MDPLIRDLLYCLAALGVAFLVARTATPPIIDAAIRMGMVDKPDGKLKQHKAPVAYLGGLSVALGVLAGIALIYEFNQQVLAILLSAAVVLVLGLIDDIGALSPQAKLAGQLLATVVLIKAGVMIKLVFLPSWVAIPLTILWMVGMTNSFNLIDIMDGLSSGVGAIAALWLALIALCAPDPISGTAFLGFALAGGLLGFRQYNTAPARIYMGDTGSLFAGFLLGALAMVNHYTIEHRLGAVVPLLVLAVPLFDTLFVMYVRWRRGMPVMLGSPDHVALRLRKWRLSTVATVRANLLAAGLFGAIGMGVMIAPLPVAIGVVSGCVVIALGLAIWLRRIDMSL
jgi:UDP-GlcNAc:undecaprenyl-phosphate GlcNAc-1-phosphate transferase